ncbi:10216_t:CDS:2 [Paraglomus occultum]|uniref:Protein YIF1 n=1 Tax=Paraglomus occultum TaxID=144539 RepID=A0A9N9FDN1_9GLOM|nr:10216_t:CDS:2 [Paraglomus occultum]
MYQQQKFYPQQTAHSPPPLQHPIPTHPPIQMRDPPSGPPGSPSPPISTGYSMMGQPMSTQGNYQGNFQGWRLEGEAAQMSLQFGKTAVIAGSEYVEKNPWTRLVRRSEQNGQMEGYEPPREDINSPDLYIPTMALVTYVLLTGIVAGTEHKFHPEVLGMNATAAFLIVISELAFIKTGCYLLSITSESQFLDLMAYSGYKFIGSIATLLVSLVAPFWIVLVTFFYAAFANGFFLLRSLRYIVIPEATTTVKRKRRINFLFFIAALQVVLISLDGYKTSTTVANASATAASVSDDINGYMLHLVLKDDQSTSAQFTIISEEEAELSRSYDRSEDAFASRVPDLSDDTIEADETPNETSSALPSKFLSKDKRLVKKESLLS